MLRDLVSTPFRFYVDWGTLGGRFPDSSSLRARIHFYPAGFFLLSPKANRARSQYPFLKWPRIYIGEQSHVGRGADLFKMGPLHTTGELLGNCRVFASLFR